MVFRRNRLTGKTEAADTQESGNALSRRFEDGDDSPTVLLDNPNDAAAETAELTDDAATRILLPDDQAAEPPPDAPPAGILVVVDGPGRGHVATFTYGMNPIGRDASQRVSLDFGDERLSREGHALVTYDGEGRKYYVQHGGGTNLTWVNGDPLLTPRELEPRDRIRVGDTTLMFLPLCDETFDWQAGDD